MLSVVAVGAVAGAIDQVPTLPFPLLSGLPGWVSEAASSPTQQSYIDMLGAAGVIGILRGKNPDEAIKRGVELVDLGCRALEVTLDTVDFARVLTGLVEQVGDRCLVGVGTVMDVAEVAVVAKLGARFALSPINPKGFVHECLRHGILAMPAVYTPQECTEAVLDGAKTVKLFPAQLWTPKALKALKGIGIFKNVHICPSGGATPENAAEWLAAGAYAVGMGSNLVGKEVSCPADAMEEAAKAWSETGRERARDLFARVS